MVVNILAKNFDTLRTSPNLTWEQSNMIEKSFQQTEEVLVQSKKSQIQSTSSDQYKILFDAAKSMLQATRHCRISATQIQQ